MNPYTYTRRAQTDASPDKGFLHAVATAKINSIMAFAIVLLAAGSTAAMASVVAKEMGQGQEYAVGVIHKTKVSGKVLGDSTAKTTIHKTTTIHPHPAGTLVNDNGTIFLMLQNGKLGIPDVNTFKSWDYSFSDAANANRADHNLPVIGIIVPRTPDSTDGQAGASSSTSTLMSIGWKVLISIPRMAVPVGLPVHVAAATDPRQNVTFAFNWGDGNSETSTSTGPYYMSAHGYIAAGQYTFTATAVNNSGDSQSKTGTIIVGTSTTTSTLPPLLPQPPTAPLGGSVSAGTAGQVNNVRVYLSLPRGGAVGDQISAGAGIDPSSSGQGIVYSFNWGDGATSNTPVGGYSSTHSYTTAGTYTVTVNAMYNNAVLGTASKNLTIVQVGTPAPSMDH